MPYRAERISGRCRQASHPAPPSKQPPGQGALYVSEDNVTSCAMQAFIAGYCEISLIKSVSERAKRLGWSILSAKSWFKLTAFFSKREQARLRALTAVNAVVLGTTTLTTRRLPTGAATTRATATAVASALFATPTSVGWFCKRDY